MKNKFVIIIAMSILVIAASSGTVSAIVTVEKIEFLTNAPEQEYSPIWTFDGSQIMYVFQGTIWNDRDSYMMNADGSDQHRTYLGEGMTVTYSDLNPNGKDLLMAKNYGYWYDIYKLNIDDGTLTALIADPTKLETCGHWSPDGTRITYHQDGDLWIANSDGSNRQQLASQYIGDNDWSPDGSKIIYSAFSNNQYDLWMINPDGTNQEQTTFTPWNEWYVSFSPNGKYIAYSSDKEGEQDLWLWEIDSDYDVRLTYNIKMHNTMPKWSPDGTKIAFVGNNPNNDYADIAVITLSFDAERPITSNVIANPNPVSVGIGITLTALVSDETTGGSAISSAEFSIDGGLFSDMNAKDGTFDEVTEEVTANIEPFMEAGVHNICVRGTDAAGNVGETECILLAVYDPDGGFVTGGGWINSPEGAYAADPMLTGKASFGFVSKYKKCQATPTGNTKFQFRAGDLNFHSSSYDWLVIAGPKAMYKGTGTINGVESYGFMLCAIDEELTPSTDVDIFRVKIWDKDDNDAVVYDNQMGDADDADLTTVIQGGNIVIHK